MVHEKSCSMIACKTPWMPPHAFDALCINDFYTSSHLFAIAEPEMHSGSSFGTGFESGSNIKWNTKVKKVKKTKMRGKISGKRCCFLQKRQDFFSQNCDPFSMPFPNPEPDPETKLFQSRSRNRNKSAMAVRL
jgi:hypothetical protein